MTRYFSPNNYLRTWFVHFADGIYTMPGRRHRCGRNHSTAPLSSTLHRDNRFQTNTQQHTHTHTREHTPNSHCTLTSLQLIWTSSSSPTTPMQTLSAAHCGRQSKALPHVMTRQCMCGCGLVVYVLCRQIMQFSDSQRNTAIHTRFYWTGGKMWCRIGALPIRRVVHL